MKFLFDLGGVFLDWHPQYFYRNIFKDKKELNFFLTNVCNDAWNLRQDAGRSIENAEKDLISKFPNYSKEIKLYYPSHRKMIKRVFESSLNLLSNLKSKKYKCYVLSNFSAETFVGMMEEYKFLKKFNGIIISGEEKIVKPDKKIFKLAIQRFNLIPQQTIFIDDRLENINSAKNIGFKTVHLKNPLNIIKQVNILIE